MMITRKLMWLSLSAILLLACGGGEEQDPADHMTTEDPVIVADPAEAFVMADSASEAMTSCSYEFRVYGTGSYSDSPVMGGTLLGTVLEDGETMFHVSAQYEVEGDQGMASPMGVFAVGADSAYAIDHVEGTFHRGHLDDGGADLLRPASYAIMNEYFLDDPFSDEIGSVVTHEGTGTLGDVQCDIYLVTYPGGQESRWHLGSDDHLPRQVERIRMDETGNVSSVVLEITELEVNPEVEPSMFHLMPPQEMEVLEYSAFLTMGLPAPQWTLMDSSGNTVSLAGLAGNVVVLDFWATWCGPCKEVMPQLQSLHEVFADEPVLVYGVNVWESGDAAAYMQENGYTYGLLLNGDAVGEEYLVSGIPTLYVIDQDGNVAFSEVGASPEIGEVLTGVIEGLLTSE